MVTPNATSKMVIAKSSTIKSAEMKFHDTRECSLNMEKYDRPMVGS